MDWIEKLLNVDPDGGNGSLEMLILLVLIAAVMVVGFYMWNKGRVGLHR